VPGLAGMQRYGAFPRFLCLLSRAFLLINFFRIITYPPVFLLRNRNRRFECLGHFTANLREWDKCSLRCTRRGAAVG